LAGRGKRCHTARLCDHSEDLTGFDRLAFLGEQPFDRPGLGRSDFVLHFHCFYDEQTLTRFNVLARRNQYAHDLSGHWRGNLLRACEADSSVAPTPPETRIHDFQAELVAGRVQQQMVRRRLGMNFE
jgi:hypothetical protein